MPILRLLLIPTATALTVALLTYLSLPALTAPALTWYLARQQIQVLDVVLNYPSLTNWVLPHLVLQADDGSWRLEISNLQAHQPSDWLWGNAIQPHLRVDAIKVQLATASQTTPPRQPPEALLALISPAAWPTSHIEIQHLELQLHRQTEPELAFSGRAGLDAQALSLSGSLSSLTHSQLPNVTLDLKATRAGTWRLQVDLTEDAATSTPPATSTETATGTDAPAITTPSPSFIDVTGNLPTPAIPRMEGTLAMQLTPLANWLSPYPTGDQPHTPNRVQTPNEAAAQSPWRELAAGLQGQLSSRWQLRLPADELALNRLEARQQFEILLRGRDSWLDTANLHGTADWSQAGLQIRLAPSSNANLWPWSYLPEQLREALDPAAWQSLPLNLQLSDTVTADWRPEDPAATRLTGRLQGQWGQATQRDQLRFNVQQLEWDSQSQGLQLHSQLSLTASRLRLGETLLEANRLDAQAEFHWSDARRELRLLAGSRIQTRVAPTTDLPVAVEIELLRTTPLEVAKPARLAASELQIKISPPPTAPYAVDIRPMRLNLDATELTAPLNLSGRLHLTHADLQPPGWRLPPWFAHVDFRLREPQLQLRGYLNAPQTATQVSFLGRYDLDSAQGHLTWRLPEHPVAPLLDRYLERPQALLLSAGDMTAAGSLKLSPSGWQLSQQTQLRGLKGRWQDIPWQGLEADLSLELDHAAGWRLAGQGNLREIQPGIPITNAKLGFLVQQRPEAAPWLEVSTASAELLGGRISASPFGTALQPLEGRINLNVEALHLDALLATAYQADLSGSGLISGHLPLDLHQGRLSVTQGELQAQPPGGWLSYRSAGLPSSAPSLQLALQALENFHYQELGLKIDYHPEGTLMLATTLKGNNPDWQRGRPLHLNLTIEENLLQLLRSLRLSSQIGESLEKRLRAK